MYGVGRPTKSNQCVTKLPRSASRTLYIPHNAPINVKSAGGGGGGGERQGVGW